MRIFLVILTLLIMPAFGLCAIVNVPADFPTISLAINAAANGDEILVAPGTYVENINFSGKDISITSTGGPTLTVIDGNNASNTVLFIMAEPVTARLQGFTITNGNALEGGGIRCFSASPMVIDCIIKENNATFGGGMFNSGSSPRVDSCIFYDNTSLASGGGMRNFFSSPRVTRCRFIKNAAERGAGMDNEAGDPIISNCIFAGNWAENNGGGLFNSATDCAIKNCTIADNTARYTAGGMENSNASPEVTNCIVYGNAPDQILNTGAGANPTVTYSDVEGGYAGMGNINADPMFASLVYGDMHIEYTSPCRNAGTAAGAPAEDFEGDIRSNPDIGADEFEHHFYVMGQWYNWGLFTPTGAIHAKIIGAPGTAPVGLFLSAFLLPTPLHHMWGDFFLGSPFFLIGPLGTIPANGIKGLISTVPPTPPGPYDIHFQALVGTDLTNLFTLGVR